MPDLPSPPLPSPSPLAQRARDLRWWLTASKRQPLLWTLLGVEFVVVPSIRSIWGAPWWLSFLIFAILFGPLVRKIRDLRYRAVRRVELADEAAERTGARRPVAAPSPEEQPTTFTRRSPAGRRLALQAAIFASWTAVDVALTSWIITTTPPVNTRDVMGCALVGLFLIGLPAALGVLNYGGTLRRIRQVLAEPAERGLVQVVGIDSRSQLWVLQRSGHPAQVTVRLLGGKHLLVAGDELRAEGTITAPVKNWRRMISPIVALTGPSGTLWAQHADPNRR